MYDLENFGLYLDFICGVPQEKGAMDFLNYQQLPVVLPIIYL